MPIKGTIKAFYREETIPDTLVGEKYFVPIIDIIVTEEAIFLDILRGSAFEELGPDEKPGEFVILTRVGEGLTSDDFILDFSQTDAYFCIEAKEIFLLLKEVSRFIVFEKPPLDIFGEPLDEKTDEHETILVSLIEDDESFDSQNLEGKKLKELLEIQDDLTDKMILLRKNTSLGDHPDNKEKILKTQQLLNKVISIIEEKKKK